MSTRVTKGFTLVEMLVSVGVFAVVTVLITGAYISVLGYARHAEAVAVANDNIAFVLENITRNIRTGSNYSCGLSLAQGDGSGCTAFTFIDNSGATVTYEHVPPGGGASGYVNQIIGGVTYAITDPKVSITSFTFDLDGSLLTDGLAPMVRIIVVGTVPGYQNNTLTFTLETLGVMRGVDL